MRNLCWISLIMVLLMLLSFSAAALGDDVDFGGGDTGGGWDSGGNDGGDWGGGWDSGGNGGGGGYGGGGYVFSGAPAGPLQLGGGAIIIILFIIAIIIMRNKNGMFGIPQGGAASAGATRRIDRQSLDLLKQKDPSFSAADIEAKVKTWSMMFENAWAKGDMSSCRPFISDSLYNTYQMQLEMMKQNGEASRTEDLAVMVCTVERWTQDGSNEYLDVWMQQKKRTYKVDINNPQKVVKGDKQTTYILEYRWQLMRSAGKVSEGAAGVRVAECPNCGAQTSINQSGKCEYCGSTLVSESFDWILNKVDKLAQTSHK